MKIYFILLLIVAYPSFGQHVLIKASGETQPFNKIRFRDDYVEITIDKKEIKISEDQVSAYYDNDYQTIYYKKLIIPDLQEELKILPSKRKKGEFEYLEREAVGAVNLYKRIESSRSPGSMSPVSPMGGVSPGGVPTTTTFYYAEKGDIYKNIYVSGLLIDREKKIESLKPFVGDDPESLKKLESDDFRLNEKNILRLIREYNLRNFQKVPASNYKSVSNVSFYTHARQKLKEKLTITVNDSLQFKLPESQLPLPIAFPNNVTSKICLSWDGGTYCTTIEPCPYAVHYYEIDYFVSDKSFELIKRTLKEFKNYMVMILK